VKLRINEEMNFESCGNVLECICLGWLMAYTKDCKTAKKLSCVVGASKPATYALSHSHVEHNGKGKKRGRRRIWAWHFIIPTQKTKTVIRVLTNNDQNEKLAF